MAVNKKLFSDNFAYDISKQVLSKGEIYDTDVINQSVELILTTGFNERVFNLSFGSSLPSYIFEFINEDSGELLLDSIIASVQKWEDRIRVTSNAASLQILDDDHAIILTLPYVIKQNGKSGIFKKKINF